MHRLFQWTPFVPPKTDKIGNFFKMRYRPDAQPCYRSACSGASHKLGKEIFLIEAHPAHANPLCGGGKPHVLDGEPHREHPVLINGVAA